jgi:hypothetical protein
MDRQTLQRSLGLKAAPSGNRVPSEAEVEGIGEEGNTFFDRTPGGTAEVQGKGRTQEGGPKYLPSRTPSYTPSRHTGDRGTEATLQQGERQQMTELKNRCQQ